MVSKEELKEKHKNKIGDDLKELEHNVDSCNRDTSLSVWSAMTDLVYAVKVNVLSNTEIDEYRKLVLNKVRQFERNCECNNRKSNNSITD